MATSKAAKPMTALMRPRSPEWGPIFSRVSDDKIDTGPPKGIILDFDDEIDDDPPEGEALSELHKVLERIEARTYSGPNRSGN